MNILDQMHNDISEIKSLLLNKQAIEIPIEEKLITAEETRKLFVPEISRQTLSNWTKDGLLKVYRMGGRLYYKQSEIFSSATELKKYKKDL